MIVFSFQPGSETPLIVAANRDEFYRRRTTPLGWWPGGEILAGRDRGYGNTFRDLWSHLTGQTQPEYGTWLGVSRNGRFAALTNFRGIQGAVGSTTAGDRSVVADRDAGKENRNAVSRGLLVSNFLSSNMSATDYAQKLELTKHEYNGYNLLFGDSNELLWFSNRSEKPAAALKPGIYGLSNALLDTPWPKVQKIKTAFSNLLPHPAVADVYRIMNDSTPAADDEVQQTGLPFAIEKGLSSPFIRLPGYGTRVTSFLNFSLSGEISFSERTYRRGQARGDTELVFMARP